MPYATPLPETPSCRFRGCILPAGHRSRQHRTRLQADLELALVGEQTAMGQTQRVAAQLTESMAEARGLAEQLREAVAANTAYQSSYHSEWRKVKILEGQLRGAVAALKRAHDALDIEHGHTADTVKDHERWFGGSSAD